MPQELSDIIVDKDETRDGDIEEIPEFDNTVDLIFDEDGKTAYMVGIRE